MFFWSHNMQQHPPRVLIWVWREIFKQKPAEDGGRMLSSCTELCSRSLNWALICSQLCLAFLPHTLGKLDTQRSNAEGLSQVVRAVITLKASSPESSDTDPGCVVVSAHTALTALCNNKPVPGQVLQGQWVMLGKCVVSISAEIWTLCRAPITEMIKMDYCNCLLDEWQHN